MNFQPELITFAAGFVAQLGAILRAYMKRKKDAGKKHQEVMKRLDQIVDRQVRSDRRQGDFEIRLQALEEKYKEAKVGVTIVPENTPEVEESRQRVKAITGEFPAAKKKNS